jgi:hypothetical protein
MQKRQACIKKANFFASLRALRETKMQPCAFYGPAQTTTGKWHNYCIFSMAMNTQNVKTCFTITFTNEQYERARRYVDDMKKHPNRIFWRGKQGKTDEELVIEQIAHRILSGFYNDDPLTAGKHIIRMDSAVNAG